MKIHLVQIKQLVRSLVGVVWFGYYGWFCLKVAANLRLQQIQEPYFFIGDTCKIDSAYKGRKKTINAGSCPATPALFI